MNKVSIWTVVGYGFGLL